MRALAGSLVLCFVLVSSAGCARENDRATSEAPSATSGSTAAKHRAQCTPSDAEGEIILHPGSFTPEEPITLGDVSLVDPVNVEVVERDVVRFTGRSTISGIIRDYPPLKNAGLADSLADWETRRPLAGLEVGPADEQQAVLVAVRLTDPHTQGHVSGVVLHDSAGDTSYAQPVLVVPPGEICTVADYDGTLAWVP